MGIHRLVHLERGRIERWHCRWIGSTYATATTFDITSNFRYFGSFVGIQKPNIHRGEEEQLYSAKEFEAV